MKLEYFIKRDEIKIRGGSKVVTIGTFIHTMYIMQQFLIFRVEQYICKHNLQFTVYKKKDPHGFFREVTRVADPETGHPVDKSSQSSVMNGFLNKLTRSTALGFTQPFNVWSLTEANSFMARSIKQKQFY